MFNRYAFVIKINLLMVILNLTICCSDRVGSSLAIFDLRLNDAWLFSQRAEKAFLACYSASRFSSDSSLLAKWRSDDQHKNNLDNWALFVFAKGLTGSNYKNIERDFVSCFFTKKSSDGRIFFETLWQDSASRLTLLRYGQVCYNLGVKDRVNGQLKLDKQLAKIRSEGALLEAKCAAGIARRAELERRFREEQVKIKKKLGIRL